MSDTPEIFTVNGHPCGAPLVKLEEYKKLECALIEANSEAFSERSKATGAFLKSARLRKNVSLLVAAARAIIEATTTKRDGIIGGPTEIAPRAIMLEHIQDLYDAERLATTELEINP